MKLVLVGLVYSSGILVRLVEEVGRVEAGRKKKKKKRCGDTFHIFPYSQEKTDGDVMPAGVIMKDEISFKDFILSDAQKFGVTFPETSTPQQRALLIGAAILVNFSFFEGQDDHNDVLKRVVM